METNSISLHCEQDDIIQLIRLLNNKIDDFFKTKERQEQSLTLPEAAKKLGIDVRTLRQHIEKGAIKAYNVGNRQRRIRYNELVKFTEGLRNSTNSPVRRGRKPQYATIFP